MWRDGQKKNVFEYRFLATGTIEEKVFQRQLSKEGLQGLVSKDGKAKSATTSRDELRKLFRYRGDCASDTYDNCQAREREDAHVQVGEPAEGDLKNWAHHFGGQGGEGLSNLPDEVMRRSAGDDVSFVFSVNVKGRDFSKDP